jgi:hypothetical protein
MSAPVKTERKHEYDTPRCWCGEASYGATQAAETQSMADLQIADDKLDELFMAWRSERTATSMRAFVDGVNTLIEDRGNVTRQRTEALRRLDALLASQSDAGVDHDRG